ncbi:lipoprotein intramolecular transacylase Lit [Gilvimarinus algae]|uniref:DUF1461 domain-containing protein n=1 Tax=Gilvimarinus algae TaxID=3058037 RepID=A0ABT8TNW0_9GAMM|nr:DUF1461 domain-containing protein [Gilvimarinus sp. SDUM040014]MDO3384102.1 DUF1461 domain-containing protein [Gilvimarinus sp. SDUM040014]
MHARYLLWPAFFIGQFLSCGFLAWHLLAQVDFAYPQAYELLNIDRHIEEFGPQNRYRRGFADTDKQAHLSLFGQINDAIHHKPEALADIRFAPDGGKTQTLLREPEVVHLQDVARLINGVYTLGWFSLGLTALTMGALLWRRGPLPRPLRVLTGVVGALSLLIAAVFVIGPKRVFYTLHTWVFPPEHPWFFYYQDSLMTTLMKAPDLFGFIAIILLSLWLLLWSISLWLFVRLWRVIPFHHTRKSNDYSARAD